MYIDFDTSNGSVDDRFIYLDDVHEFTIRNDGDATLVVDGALELKTRESFEFNNNAGYPLKGSKEVRFKDDGTDKRYTIIKNYLVCD